MSGSYPSNYRPRGSLPVGVAIIAILIGLFAILLVIAGVLILIASTLSLGIVPSSFFGLVGTVAGAIFLILGLVILAVATGLWGQELWALVLTLIVLAIFLAADVYASTYTLGFFIDVILFIYLIAVSGHFD